MCAVGNLSGSLAFGARGSDNEGSLSAHCKAAARLGTSLSSTQSADPLPCPSPEEALRPQDIPRLKQLLSLCGICQIVEARASSHRSEGGFFH